MTEQATSPAESVLTKPARPRLSPAGPIVRAGDAELWGAAAAAREGAERYAERTRRWARAAYARARERGLREGREEGAAAAAKLVAGAQAEIDRLLVQIEAQLPRLVAEIVESVLGAFDPGELLPFAVRKAVLRLNETTDIRIKVAPAIYETMRAALASATDGPAGQRLRVEADPTLEGGACLIWTELGNVELSLAAQLRALRAELGTLSENGPSS
jgi:type III secretion protein L